jgi:antitoxin component YwqK of YwqJK toxin-antitoxin module
LPADSNVVNVIAYYNNGVKKSEAFYSDFKNKKQEGFSREWDKIGNMISEIQYSNGNVNGKILTYWPNGITKRRDFYKN